MYAELLQKLFLRGIDALVHGTRSEPLELDPFISTDECAVYVHYPFCTSACKYCQFGKTIDTTAMTRYGRDLLREIELWAGLPSLKSRGVSSLYFGGGTPSLMPLDLLEKVLSAVRSVFGRASTPETTMECNPGSIRFEYLDRYMSLGINRFSIGIQSFHDPVLCEMGRSYDGAFARRAVRQLSTVANARFNIDLMYGFESQTRDMFTDDISRAVECGSSHISLFALTPPRGLAESGAPAQKARLKRLCEMYIAGRKVLESQGFIQYSTEDFSRTPLDQDRYQTDCWRVPAKNIIAFGTHGFGSLDGAYYSKSRDLAGYSREVGVGAFPLTLGRIAPRKERARKFLLGLHYLAIDRAEFRKRHGCDPVRGCAVLTQMLRIAGLIRVSESVIELTEKGRLIYSDLWARTMSGALDA